MTVNITIDGRTFIAENNGDCYIVGRKADIRVPEGIFDVAVTVDDPTYNCEYHNAELIEPYSIDGRYWFAFRELTSEELKQKELEKTIELLTDCLLEMSETVYA